MVATRVRFPRFCDLSKADLQCDLHVHTKRTDGTASVAALLTAAVDRNLARLAFTEHVRHDSYWFNSFAQEVRLAARLYPTLYVLVGCETKAMDACGTLDVSDAITCRSDIILGSVHRFPDGRGGFLDTSTLTAAEFANREFEWALGLLNSTADVLAHPGGMYARRYGADLPAPLMRALLQRSLERGKAVEFNASYIQDPRAMATLYRQMNPHVSIASDVHKLHELGHARDVLTALEAV